ncbi:uncharacterized protein LOC119547832 [Drosophila subpulchrella]|uniref:uncharacterized protein LOC119547832 n=1 Tax=Drosophila subpulchrella TaxID=1486046 RepID=UPI0018A1B4D5|nr:uncharacterized protein LOC119547832 [Drosophila subpulchrella]
MSSRRSIGSYHGSRRDSVHTDAPCNPFDNRNSEVVPRPYELMRQRNCKTEKFIPFERYPTIRPPVSKCSYDKTKNWLSESVDQGGCEDISAKAQDAIKIWKNSPHKSTLKYYGVANGSYLPEAVRFNRTLTSSLKHASGLRKRVPSPPLAPKPARPPHPAPLCQPYILNRQALKAELQRMPIARQKLHPKEAFGTLFCEKTQDPMDPLGVDAATTRMVSLREALDMVRPEKPPKHGLRRNHWYCPAKCGERENKCTDYEWAKYKLDSRPYDEAFHKWFLDQKAPPDNEPHDYDELYRRFQACFEVKPQPDPDCMAMAKCCADVIKEFKEEGGGGAGGGGGGGAGGWGGGEGGEGGGGEGEGGGAGGGGGPGGGGPKKEGQPGGPGPSQGPGPGPSPGGTNRPEKAKEKGDGDKEDIEKDKTKDKGKGTDKDKSTGQDKDKTKETEKGNDKEGDKKDKDKKKDKIQDPDKGKPKDPDQEEKDKNKNKGKGKGKNINKVTNPDEETGSGKKKDVKDPDLEKPNPLKPPKPPKEQFESNTDTSTRIFSSLDTRESDKVPIRPIEEPSKEPPPKGEIEEKPQKPPSKKPPGKKPPNKKPGKPKPPKVDKGEKDKEEEAVKECPTCPPADCPCSICDCLYAQKLPVSPAMKKVFAQEKVRKMREYLRQMRHREYMECAGQKPTAPQHKVDPISCDNCFCQDPKISEYCECLGALQHLQRLLGKERHPIVNNELLFNLEDLRQRIARRMCECI